MFTREIAFLIFIFLSIISPAFTAGDSIPTQVPPVQELSDADVRIPEKGYFDSYLSQKDYQYGGDYKPPANNSFFSRLWKRILSIWKYGLDALMSFPFVLKLLFFALCLLLLFVIATRTKLYKVFYTDPEVPGPEYSEVNPLDEKYDFDEAIRMQISQKNFRNAIRLLHLRILKELETKGIIRFSREKTNREYAREITDSNQRRTFHELAGIYNRIWFGNYSLSKDEFDSLASGFYQFSAEINGQKE